MPENDALRSRSLVFPILLICVGALFLYRTWQPAFEPWPVIRTYWPLILIFVGLGKMWDSFRAAKESRSGVSIGSTIGVLLFVVVIVVLLWHGHAFTNQEGRFATTIDHVSETRDLEGAKRLNAAITMPAGQLNLSGGTSRAVDADFEYKAAWSRPRMDYHVSGDTADLDISQDNRGPALGPEDNTWRVHLNNSVPVELQVKMGAAQGNLKFREINLKELRIEIGVGQVNVDLTGDRSVDANIEIHGGIGQAVIRLPKNVGVVVEAHGGIGAITTHGLKKEEDKYVNEAYRKSPHTLNVTANGGIGNIDLSVEP